MNEKVGTMRTMGFAGAVAAVGLMLTAGSAGAAIVVQSTVANQLFTLNSGAMLEDFDAIHSPYTSFTGNVVGPFFEDGDGDHDVNGTAPPPYDGAGSITVCCQGANTYEGDPTRYASVQGGGSSTFSVLGGRYLSDFSFYMGSPDTYNKMTFNLLGGGSQIFNGTEIWNGANFGGDRTKGFRVYYNFNGAKVSSIQFESGSNAFEFDGLAGTVVPEPGAWALMILGFGAAGAMLRRRRAVVA